MKRALEERLDHVAEGVVDDAVAERRGRDQAPLGLVDVEGVRTGRAGSVRRRQLLLQRRPGCPPAGTRTRRRRDARACPCWRGGRPAAGCPRNTVART